MPRPRDVVCDRPQILFVGINQMLEREGIDRDSLNLPPLQLKLVQSVLEANAKAAVVLLNGGPVSLALPRVGGGGPSPRAMDIPAVLDMFWAGGSGVVVLPCGAGKTLVGAAAMAQAKATTLILVTNTVAGRQWKRELIARTSLTEEEIGEYSGERKEIRPVTIATYQIMTTRRKGEYRHLELFDSRDWGLIVYDEVHLLPAPIFRLTADLQSRRRLGLTATLIREESLYVSAGANAEKTAQAGRGSALTILERSNADNQPWIRAFVRLEQGTQTREVTGWLPAKTLVAASTANGDEVVFGQNMTTITFALARAIGRELRSGDEIVVTTLDHDANVAPWRALEEKGVVIRQVDVREADCTLDLDDLKKKITAKTKLVAVGYASNAVGTINPVAEITKLAHAAGAFVFIDAVHYAPHGPIDVRALDCDFLVCSPYKFFGPHMGTLYGKREHLLRFQPYKVRPAPDTLPDRWETGTQVQELIAGIGGPYLLVGPKWPDDGSACSRSIVGRLITGSRVSEPFVIHDAGGADIADFSASPDGNGCANRQPGQSSVL